MTSGHTSNAALAARPTTFVLLSRADIRASRCTMDRPAQASSMCRYEMPKSLEGCLKENEFIMRTFPIVMIVGLRGAFCYRPFHAYSCLVLMKRPAGFLGVTGNVTEYNGISTILDLRNEYSCSFLLRVRRVLSFLSFSFSA